MYVIALSGGKQFRIEKNSTIRVPSLNLPVGEKVRLDQILLFNNEGRTEVGNPFLQGAYAEGRVVQHGRQGKITIVKYKRRKGYRRKLGHRQGFTEIVIDTIVPGTKKKAAAKAAEKKVKKPAKAKVETKKEKELAQAAAEVPAKKKPAAKVKTEAAPAKKPKAVKKAPATVSAKAREEAKAKVAKPKAAEKKPAAGAKPKTETKTARAAKKKPQATPAAKAKAETGKAKAKAEVEAWYHPCACIIHRGCSCRLGTGRLTLKIARRELELISYIIA